MAPIEVRDLHGRDTARGGDGRPGQHDLRDINTFNLGHDGRQSLRDRLIPGWHGRRPPADHGGASSLVGHGHLRSRGQHLGQQDRLAIVGEVEIARRGRGQHDARYRVRGGHGREAHSGDAAPLRRAQRLAELHGAQGLPGARQSAATVGPELNLADAMGPPHRDLGQDRDQVAQARAGRNGFEDDG
ncbi:hypothetical protein DSECCO2_382350 [anaerobic digester metagenome]